MSAITKKVEQEMKNQTKVKQDDNSDDDVEDKAPAPQVVEKPTPAKKAPAKKGKGTSPAAVGKKVVEEVNNFNAAGFNKLWDELIRQQGEMTKLIENHNKLGQMVQAALKEFGVKYSKMADTINHNAEETENCRSLAGAVECKLRKVEERSSRANAAVVKSVQAQITKAIKDLETKLASKEEEK